MNLSKEPVWEINLTSHHYKQATKRQMNDHLSTAVKNSIKEKSIPFDWINSNLWNWFSILKWWNEFFFETIPSSTIECLFWRTNLSSIRQVLLSTDISFTLFHFWKVGDLFAFWQVKVLSSTEQEQGTLGVFVSTARAKLCMSIRKKPWPSNMCLCFFLCGFPMEMGTLPWPELQMYPIYDCVWSQSPILKDLHSCSKPLPRLQLLSCVGLCKTETAHVIYGRTAFDEGVGWVSLLCRYCRQCKICFDQRLTSEK